MHASLSLSTAAPLAPGDRLVATVVFTDDCGRKLDVSTLALASLLMAGPRDPLRTQTAVKLLNCPDAPFAREIDLQNPQYTVPAQANLAVAADGTLTYTFGPVSDEPAGTYTVGILAARKGSDGMADPAAQDLALADVQVGTATVEPEYVSGATASSTCLACHRMPGARYAYMAHTQPSTFGHGLPAADMASVAGCKLCHNARGFSPNPTLRKVHGVHRGANQLAPGAAHSDWADPLPAPDPWGTDTTLPDFTDVTFPSMPGAERDCAACHADDRWKTAPSRAACGSCHDNVNFATGDAVPASPTGVSCTSTANCTSANPHYTCDLGSASPTYHSCVLGGAGLHPVQTDDQVCGACHPADGPFQSGSYPVSTAHLIPARTLTKHIHIASATLLGATGLGGAFVVGDVPILDFVLQNDAGPVTGISGTVSATAILGGPTDDRRLVYPAGSLTSGNFGTLDSSDAANGHYRYTFKSPATVASPTPGSGGFPAQSRDAYNAGLGPRTNPDGTYTVWLYVNQSGTVAANQGPATGVTFRDADNAVVNFQLYASPPTASPPPPRGRAAVTTDACNACHADVQAHGGGRRDAAEQCSLCHSPLAMGRNTANSGARDFGYSQGANCTLDADCPLNKLATAAGDTSNTWETCSPVYPDPAPYTTPPNPPPVPWNVCWANKAPVTFPIDFGPMIHNLHFARLRGGYVERNNAFGLGGKLVLQGSSGTLTDFSTLLAPMDVRNCRKCHADTGGACTSDVQCPIGQGCVSGKCANVAWLAPSARACISCHDTSAAYAHAQLNTWAGPDGPVESCDVCHGPGAEQAVDVAHEVQNPFKPTYMREP